MREGRGMRIAAVAGLVLCATGRVGAGAPAAPRSFAYVLQAEGLGKTRGEVVRRLADCGRDWIILDPFFEGDDDGRWAEKDLAAIRSGRAGRKVVAYLSIGEAENYRPYWKREWDTARDGRPDPKAPAWLGDENPEWKGNYKVRYWDAAWQDIMLGQLEAIVRAGFDGVYLDLVDAFETFEFDPATKDWIDHRPNPATGKTYREDMIAWVRRIADEARRRKPGFVVIPQNGVQLLEDAAFLATVDAVGVEDLFTDGNRNQPKNHVDPSLGFLDRATKAGKPVLLIEYGTKPAAVKRSTDGAAGKGFVLLVTDRPLKTLGRSGEADTR